MNLVFTYNTKKSKYSYNLDEQDDIEFDSPQTINAITNILKELGHTVIPIEADYGAFNKLKRLRSHVDLVFNIAEGLSGDARESQIPLFCEILRIPYTHSSPTTTAICLDKTYTKLLVKGAGLCKVPASTLLKSSNDKLDDSNLKYPLLIKPNLEGSSKGILDGNVVQNKRQLIKRCKHIFSKYEGELLIEELLLGREFTVCVLNDKKPRVLPIIEQKFDFMPDGMHHIAGYELKWFLEDHLNKLTDAYDCPANIGGKLKNEIEQTTVGITKLLAICDLARFDYRLDSKGVLNFLEVNPLPGINPSKDEISYFPIAARIAGYSYKKMLEVIINSALKRFTQ